MSYQLLSLTNPKARKEYGCIWCREKIQKGEVHVHESSKYEGDFQDHRWHPECQEAAGKFFRDNNAEDFEPHFFKRGSSEEA